jgi:hypothetical protein
VWVVAETLVVETVTVVAEALVTLMTVCRLVVVSEAVVAVKLKLVPVFVCMLVVMVVVLSHANSAQKEYLQPSPSV